MTTVDSLRVALAAMKRTWSLRSQKDFRLACNSRAISEVLAHIDDLTSELAKCRDAMPIPVPGDAREAAWSQAMSDPLEVSQYVKETMNAQVLEIDGLKYGEFVCQKCGLRKDADHPVAHDF